MATKHPHGKGDPHGNCMLFKVSVGIRLCMFNHNVQGKCEPSGNGHDCRYLGYIMVVMRVDVG